MDDLITVAATIHAAQIQANYTLWAASISSIVGAAGIIFAAWYAWQSGIKLHQHNNIIEAKREVYLDFIAKYNLFIKSMDLIWIKPESYYEEFFLHHRDFEVAIEKVLLICETKNKELIYDFYGLMISQFSKFIDVVNRYRVLESELKDKEQTYNQVNENLKNISSYFKEMASTLIFDQKKFQEYRDLMKETNNDHASVKHSFNSFEEIRKQLKEVNHEYFYNSRRMALKVSLALRGELGLISDIELEERLNREFYPEDVA